MSFWNDVFGISARPASAPQSSAAARTARRLNPNILHSYERRLHIFIEDIRDTDGRLYRVEYRSNADGSSATAWCLHKPWAGNPYNIRTSHLYSSDQICVNHIPRNLNDTILRARYWCSAYSYLREHGSWPG